MIPQRTLAGTCEITTGALSITQRPPIYTGESAALKVEVSFTFQNVAYQLPSGVVAEMYMKFPNTEKMTVTVPMEISGNKASGVLTGEQTGLEGYPLLIIQLTDTETASLIVACATPVKVSDVRGNLVVDTRAPTPSEIVYVGRSPYIDPTTKHWITWDTEQAKYVDTGINAEGVIGFTPSISIGTVQSVPTGESAEVTRTGTDRNPIFNFKLPRSGDGVGIYPVSVPIAVAEWREESGVYKYTFSDATIKAYMTVLESWLDDEAVQLGEVWYTVNNGSLVVNTDVVPTAAWALHVTLGTNGTDVLEDVADLESRFPVSIADGGTGGTTAATARQALGITGANVPTSAISGETNVDGAIGNLDSNKTSNISIETITASTQNDFLKSVCNDFYNNYNIVDKPVNFIATWADHDYYTGMLRKRGTYVWCMVYSGYDVIACRYNTTNQELVLNNISQQIYGVQSGLAIIVNGDVAAQAVPADGYAYIKNNTHGLAEGLYINNSSSAFPTTGGTADSTTFKSVSKGGFNNLIEVRYGTFKRDCVLSHQFGSVYCDTSNVDISLPQVEGKNLVGVIVHPNDTLYVWVGRLTISGSINKIIRMYVYGYQAETLTDAEFYYTAFYK